MDRRIKNQITQTQKKKPAPNSRQELGAGR